MKYGRGNPELHAEIAATRLLTALGFGADHMYTVRKVRCAGCPMFPFQALKCLGETGFERTCFAGGIDYSSTTEFEHVSIERRLEGRRIESTPDQGWAFYEIDKVDEAAGGSPRAHVDAVKLLAVVIAHWDNKAENQRLLCLPGGDLPDGGCARPYAILQDLGASFGPTKLDLHNWRSTPVWADARACRVSMKQMPWGGATFPEQRISEAGTAVPVVAAGAAVARATAGPVRRRARGALGRDHRRGAPRQRVGGGVPRQGPADQRGGALRRLLTNPKLQAPKPNHSQTQIPNETPNSQYPTQQ